MSEEWRPVNGYEGLYEVSSLGRVRSLDREVNCRGRWGDLVRRYPGVVLSQGSARTGYKYVTLCNDQKATKRVHRLVAEAFIPNPDNLPLVLHGRNGVSDNSLGNLRWGVQEENIRDSVRDGTHRNTRKTHCKRGHEFTPENTGIRGGSARKCLRCHADWESFYQRRNSHPDIRALQRAHGHGDRGADGRDLAYIDEAISAWTAWREYVEKDMLGGQL